MRMQKELAAEQKPPIGIKSQAVTNGFNIASGAGYEP